MGWGGDMLCDPTLQGLTPLGLKSDLVVEGRATLAKVQSQRVGNLFPTEVSETSVGRRRPTLFAAKPWQLEGLAARFLGPRGTVGVVGPPARSAHRRVSSRLGRAQEG